MQEFYGAENAQSDPLEVTHRWLEVAKGLGEAEYDAVHLASVDASGLPDLRVVYIREIDAQGFVFYTNYQSAKGQELQSGKAAINYFFPKWRRQIRVRGLVQKLTPERSDAYFLSRPEGSRLGAWMSQQSRPVNSREQMEMEIEHLDPGIAGKRPPHWGGYCLLPLQMEFWAMGEFRVHDRFAWRRAALDQPWDMQRLYP